MNYTIFFTISSLIYSILLIVVMLNSKLPKTRENSLYKAMVGSNFLGIIIELITSFLILKLGSNSIIFKVFSRLFLIYLVIWITLLTTYIFTVSHKAEKNKLNKIYIFFTIALICLTIAVSILPLYYNTKLIYSYGPSTQLIYYVSEIYIMLGFVSMLINYKHAKTKSYAPLFVYISGGIIIMLIQSNHPEYLLMTFMETLVTFITYFTLDKKVKKEEKNIEEDKK